MNRYLAWSTIASVLGTVVCCVLLFAQKPSVVYLVFVMPLVAGNGFVAALRRARAAPRSGLAIALTVLHGLGGTLAIVVVVLLLRQSTFHAFD
jgi:hypothetical protein